MGEETTSGPADPQVTLHEVTARNLKAVLSLDVAESQGKFVASNAKSIAEAHFHPEAWFRAIYVGDQPVGFLCCTTRACDLILDNSDITSSGAS